MANTAVRPTEAKEVSWQQFGKNFDRPVTIDEAIKIAGLDYDVETAPLLRVPNEVIESIKELTPLGPLHHPGEIAGILALKEVLPEVPMVAVYDTAFHQTMEEEAYLYPYT